MKKVCLFLAAIYLLICVVSPVNASEYVEQDRGNDFLIEILEVSDSEVLSIHEDQSEETASVEIIDTYDYEAAYASILTTLQENNPSLSAEEMEAYATEFVMGIYEINQAVIRGETVSDDGIYYLGTVQEELGDGNQIQPMDSGLAGYDVIIYDGWVVAPHYVDTVGWVAYNSTWFGADSYNSSAKSEFKFSVKASVSLTVGWRNTDGLTRSAALSFGIPASASFVVASEIEAGYLVYAEPWTKTMVRPYLFYSEDEYVGQQGFQCYNTFTGAYNYYIEEVRGYERYVTEIGIKTWTATNEDKNPALTPPNPPVGWS